MDTSTTHTRTVTSKDGTIIAYEQTGTGPTLIMIDPAGGFHGFRPMEEVIPLLTPHFTVVTYDRRGRGSSTDTLPYAGIYGIRRKRDTEKRLALTSSNFSV